ncbi:MAG: hypothetical protein RLY16_1358 [Bacteroidota bacterium]|jgi:glycosyltransferase involved in cell wall biosynthesis
MKPKVIWIAHEGNVSGANFCLLEFMAIAKQEGWESLLLLPAQGSMLEAAAKIGIPTKIVHYYSWVRKIEEPFFNQKFIKRLLRNSFAVAQIIKIILKEKPTHIFTNTSVINIGAWAAALTFKKHFWYIHEMGQEDFGFKLPWGKLSYQFMKWTSTKLLTNSYHLQKKYLNIYPSLPIEVVRYAVEIEPKAEAIPWQLHQPVKLLLMGQVIENKGHLFAVKALKCLLDEGLKVTLTIVGSTQDQVFYQRLRALIEELGIGTYVNFHPHTNDIASIYHAHHLLLMCSKCEAFGRVTIEAMKLGLPVVGANTGGTAELIKADVTGYLYQQDDANALATQIKKAIHQTDTRAKIIIAAKEFAFNTTGRKPIIEAFNN